MAVAAARRRTDGDELQPPGARIGGDQVVEPRLVDRNLAARERGNFPGVLVDTGPKSNQAS
jgi:hypothetical protein